MGDDMNMRNSRELLNRSNRLIITVVATPIVTLHYAAITVQYSTVEYSNMRMQCCDVAIEDHAIRRYMVER